MLMTDSLEQRTQLTDVVKNARQQYQLLLNFASIASNINSRSRSVTLMRQSERSVTSLQTDDDLSETSVSINNREERKTMTQIAKEYVNDRKRFNVHTAIHYEIMMHEYEMSSNCNVLIEEDKHRYSSFQSISSYCRH